MRKSCLLFLLCMFAFFVNAQNGFEPGYIITNKDEKVSGLIKDRKYSYEFKSSQKIKFQNPQGEIEKLRADDIKGYVKNETEVYQTLVLGIEGKKRFVRKLETGPIILFAEIGGRLFDKDPGNPYTGQGSFLYVQIKGVTQKRTGDYYLQTENDPSTLMEWRPRDYKMTAKYFFRDDKDLVKQIEEDKYGYSDLQAIVRIYNDWKIKQ